MSAPGAMQVSKEPLTSLLKVIMDRLQGASVKPSLGGSGSTLHKRRRSESTENADATGDVSVERSDEESEEEEAILAPVMSSSRGPITAADRRAATLRNPFTCELLSKTSSKGFYESRYADVPLSMFGCSPLVPIGDAPVKLKTFCGKACCYLRLGTSLVITGTIVEVMDDMCQITPDRGQNVAVEWVQVGRLHHVPENLSQVRKDAQEYIVRILSEQA